MVLQNMQEKNNIFNKLRSINYHLNRNRKFFFFNYAEKPPEEDFSILNVKYIHFFIIYEALNFYKRVSSSYFFQLWFHFSCQMEC